jgi:hypothetical protein
MSVSPLFRAIGPSSTFKLILGEMTRIIKIVIANGLPSAEGKSEVLIQALITVG